MKGRSVWLAAFVAALFASVARASEQSSLDLLGAANEAFVESARVSATNPDRSEALLRRAIAGYRGALEEAPRSARVRFNLGTALLLDGQVGEAVLELRRAARLAPGDARIAQNLAAARGRVRTKVNVSEERSALQRLSVWRGGVSQRTRFLFAIALINLGVLVGVVRLTPLKGAAPAWIGWTALGAGLLSGGTLWVDHAMIDKRAAIVIEERMGRTGPGERVYEASFTSPLSEGVEATVLETRAGWARVRLLDGRETWLPEDAIERV